MKKPNFKNLALMGITGGVALCSSASASDILNKDNANHLLAAGCGGKGGCGSLTAYQPHGCGSQQGQSYAPQGGCNSRGYVSYQPQQGCNSQPQQGCNGSRPQSYYGATQASCHSPQGCSSQGAPKVDGQPPVGQPPVGQPQARGNYSQWETNGRVATADTTATSRTAEEAQALSQLNEEGKSIYRGLDPAGKAMANQAINQNKNKSAEEKTQAVKAIAQKLSEKRANANAPRS